MLNVAGFRPGMSVLDLGAGDGRVLLRAMQRGACRSEGWELNPDVFQLGQMHLYNSFDGDPRHRERCCLYWYLLNGYW